MTETASDTGPPQPGAGRGFVPFAAGWRPFFPAAAVWAAAAVPLWLLAVEGHLPLDVAWHAHEMVFGFAAAALAGFLLTAVPNWTGRRPLAGPPLAALFLLWCAGRVTVAAGVVPVVDLLFLPVLGAVALRAVVAARNVRNYGIVAAVFLLAGANLAYHAYDETAGVHAAIWLLTLLVAVIGGRITPAFTQTALRQGGRADAECTTPPMLGRAAVAAVALAGITAVAAPGTPLSAAVAFAAAALSAARMAGWRSFATWRSPIVWILHVGMAWLPAALMLQGLADLGWAPSPAAALHALTAGLIGTMILAVASRAALGHSGRRLVASPATVAAYAAVTVGALLRVAATEWDVVVLAGLLWSGGFALFALAYLPVFLRPRADGRPG